jgi:hypothetical protein
VARAMPAAASRARGEGGKTVADAPQPGALCGIRTSGRAPTLEEAQGAAVPGELPQVAGLGEA